MTNVMMINSREAVGEAKLSSALTKFLRCKFKKEIMSKDPETDLERDRGFTDETFQGGEGTSR